MDEFYTLEIDKSLSMEDPRRPMENLTQMLTQTLHTPLWRHPSHTTSPKSDDIMGAHLKIVGMMKNVERQELS